ncbi:hypothetical protein Tc00.1047053507757.26 [Trypanosoma cruzi]|uniref:Secreted protein n=1 Tax=Trypanosoma cruzi (strain CL Brener) TaxID=353153 RepID=Q4D2Z0_TRYCC|nr:hypothetical protein Tc00.1047053507757.26 [Trypanosoma cruzi]EAN86894.1 hypothetical protein Tc00.1047053507757.26 [Trypanosoma cruzi]|eukprot:XP_808745.1 hypothetical protein [Trypanosoma cruzi strain CL Brener]
MNDVCESVFLIRFILLILRLGDGGDSACFLFVCVASAFPLQSPHLAVGSRWGCILVSSCDLLVSGASHGAAAVSAGGVAPGVWRVRDVTLAPPPMRRAGGTTPMTHGPCLLTTQLSLLFFPCLCSLVEGCTV